MNLATMIQQAAEAAQPGAKRVHQRPGAPGGRLNPMHLKAVPRYREHLLNQCLTTPELAAKLGSSWSSNIIKTLYRFEGLGLVRQVNSSPRGGPYGKTPKTWTWAGD